MSTKIHRITLFKIPREKDQQRLLAIYKQMTNEALKDGSPYIISVQVGTAFADQRSQGYTVAVVSVFASKDDMVYYDNECEAHGRLKAVAKSIHEGVMTVYFESIVG